MGSFYIESENDAERYREIFDCMGAAPLNPLDSQALMRLRANDYTQGEAMSWLERLIIETAQTCREALGSWNRIGQLCLLILTIAAGLALVLWVTHG